MSKEATIIQSFNDVKRQYEYSVKGYDVTESVKILIKRHKEEYDKEKKIFASIDGYLEAQKEYQSQITDLEAKLAIYEKDDFEDLYYKSLEQRKVLEQQLTLAKENESFEKEKKENAWEFIEDLKQQLAKKEKENNELVFIIEEIEQFAWEQLNNENFDKYKAYDEMFTKIKELKEGKWYENI